MLVSSELTSRLLKKAVHADPSLEADPARLSDLSRRALRSPDTLVNDDEDRAFLALDRAVQRARQEIDDELDSLYYDSEPGAAPAQRPQGRMPKTQVLLARCIALDEHCYDARTLDVLVRCETSDEALAGLDALEPEARAWCAERADLYDGPVADPWDAVFLRPWLRIKARAIDLLVQASCYREAARRCEEMLAFAPTDGQGIRHILALVCARLEDEERLTQLDCSYGHEGSCWMHIARSVLLYKLGRMDAARRALIGLADLCPGAAYYLAYPSYVPPYLPDRPLYAPGTDQESLLATYEADFLVVDTPEFVTWAQSITRFADAARAFGKSHGEL